MTLATTSVGIAAVYRLPNYPITQLPNYPMLYTPPCPFSLTRPREVAKRCSNANPRRNRQLPDYPIIRLPDSESVPMPVVMDADRMARTFARIAHEIVERNRGIE